MSTADESSFIELLLANERIQRWLDDIKLYDSENSSSRRVSLSLPSFLCHVSISSSLNICFEFSFTRYHMWKLRR